MKSELEKFLDVLLQLLRHLREQMGEWAWYALGVALIIGIVISVLALLWIRRGGLREGATRRFFAERRMIEHWLRTH